MSEIIKIVWAEAGFDPNTLKSKMSTTVTNNLLTKLITFPNVCVLK